MISIKTRNIESITKKLGEVPWGARGAATESAAKVIIGNERTGLQHYPNRVTHGAGNPYEWNSEKQRRAFFATDGFGRGIPSKRTFDLRFGWRVSKWGDGTAIRILNDTVEVIYTMGKKMQHGHITDGWRYYGDVIAGLSPSINKAINEAVHRFLKAKGLV
jgi:hypothetical protein